MTRDPRPDHDLEDRLRSWLQDPRTGEHIHATRSVEEGLRRSALERRSRFDSPLLRAVVLGAAAAIVGIAAWIGIAIFGPLLERPSVGTPPPSAASAASRTIAQLTVPAGDVIAASVLDDQLWLLSQAGTLYKLDAATGANRGSVEVGGNGCGDLAVTTTSVWFRVCPPGPSLGRTEIVQVRAADLSILGRLSFPTPVGNAPAATSAGLWVVVDPDAGQLALISAETTQVSSRLVLDEAIEAVATRSDELWVSLRDANAVAEVDERSGKIAARVPLDHAPGRLLLDADDLWVGGRRAGWLWRIDVGSRKVVRTYRLATPDVTEVAPADGGPWVLVGAEAMFIDRARGEVVDRVQVRGHSVNLAPQFVGSTFALAPVGDWVWFVPPTGEMQLLRGR